MDTRTAARFANASYDMLGSGTKEERASKINESIADTGYQVDLQHSNRDILTLRNESENKLYVSHRGTDTSGRRTKQDVTSDMLFGLGMQSNDKYFNDRRRRTARAVKTADADTFVSVSGHSLGGATSSYSMTNPKVRKRVNQVDTFNTATEVVPPTTKRPIGKNALNDLNNKTTHYRNTTDIVSVNHKKLPFGKVVESETNLGKISRRRYVPRGASNLFKTVDALNAHTLNQWL